MSLDVWTFQCLSIDYLFTTEHVQLEATKSEMDSAADNLRTQLSLEQQAHTQTQRREAAAQQHCQEVAVQLQVKQQEMNNLSAELQSTFASGQTMNLRIVQLQKQVDTREQQRCAFCP